MSRTPASPPPGDRPAPPAPPTPPSPWRNWYIPIAIALALILYLSMRSYNPNVVSLSYSQFITYAQQHKVKDVTFGASSGGNTPATGTLTNGNPYNTVIPGQPGPAFSDQLRADGVKSISASSGSPSLASNILLWLIILSPVILAFWLFRRLSRGAAGQLQGVMGVGRSRAKLFDAERPSTKFADVAGYEGAKEEIGEVIDFLRNPLRYQRAGAVPPRGVLMVGPPGTGKTLLARAVAGEASVPFFSVTGSSFVEMFVGVGAARVRDLFTEARKRSPAIIFVDEVDAIGQRRAGSGAVVANDEREQTLNQLLAEMDGFDITQGIVVLAATNRPEVLDPALLRPGRFDRQITIPLPTLDERAEILAVHCRGKRLAPGVDLKVVARGTPGFSGADLANLANEAAIFAVRGNREVLSAADFDDARDRILLGRREGSNVLLPEEKHAVAVHEAGHALVAALSDHADPVAKVTILPAGQALGVTQQLPLIERHLYGEDYLLDSLAVRLGGRAAELAELGQGSTGAANDLSTATEIAIRMVREFGLSPELGPVGYPQGGSVFLGGGGSALSSRPFAESTQAAIDAEVARLLREAERTAVALIRSHQDELRRLVRLLLDRETVDGAEVYKIVDRPVPERREDIEIAPHIVTQPTDGQVPLCPLELGADIVVHSATKFIGGHSDLLLGLAIAADPGLAGRIRRRRMLDGATPGGLEAFLALRGLRTLAVRLERGQASAGELARRLLDHPAVSRVRYPGLPDDPGHKLAAAQMDGFGAMISFEVGGGAAAADALCERLELIISATSLGGVETTIEHRRRTPGHEHLPPGLLRLSVGCEDVEDLWEDLAAALG